MDVRSSVNIIMSVCGNRRFIGEILIYGDQLSSTHWGKFQELQDDMKNSENLMKRIKEIYEAKTKIPNKMDEIQSMIYGGCSHLLKIWFS